MKHVFRFLILGMIIMACFNIAYNSVKAVSEYMEWGHLTIDQKRQKLFGDYYTFLQLVKNNTKEKDKVFIYYKDGDKWLVYFQSIYFLYPRFAIGSVDTKELVKQSAERKYKYIAIYNSELRSNDYQKINSFSTKNNYGAVYKLK